MHSFASTGLALLLAWLGLSPPLRAACDAATPAAETGEKVTSLDEIVNRIETEGRRYIFIGERHGIAPAKAFAVDIANALADFGYDVGLYVEGFRTDCSLRDDTCPNLARLFNAKAFNRLLDEARVPVHPLDPPERDGRAGRMAAAIAAGSEAIRVVLIGRSHVVHADDPGAELWVYGGGMRYPDPGDVVKAFPRAQTLTVALDDAEQVGEPYLLRPDGCRADYSLLVSGG